MAFCKLPALETTMGMEYTIVTSPPKRIADQLTAAFPSSGAAGVAVVPVALRAGVDLSKGGGAAEAERERLADQFTQWAVAVAGRLSSKGHWADYVDPTTHTAVMHNEAGATFAEAEAVALLLGYKAPIANREFLLLHPKWGGAAFAGTLLARAPEAAVREAIAAVAAQCAA
ncbi:MAG: hypothetical protein J3K34DRAFT_408426 [Monoraphidium minutum]|nr:MAG: hypothetical protein J3K34DRAFT_408426 [Monoraphidium minutum]